MIIFYAVPNGVGDRLLGVTSSYILSQIFDVPFRIYWKTPFELTDILTPKIDWNKDDYPCTITNDECDRIIVNEHSGQEKFDEINLSIETKGYALIDCIYPYYIYLCERFNMYSNMSIEHVYSHIFHTLFKIPRNLSSKLIDGKNTIGIQIRSLTKISYDFPKLSPEGVYDFLNAAQKMCESDDSLTAIYLSTDSNVIVKEFPDRIILSNNKTIPIIKSDGVCKHIFYEQFENSKDKCKLFIDMLNLSRCEKLLISHWSNYGRSAALLSGNDPYIISMKINRSEKQTEIWYQIKVEEGITNPNRAFGVDICESQKDAIKYPLCKLLSKSTI